MAIELKVPEVGESITEVMIGVWKKNVGDAVSADEVIVEIESDKATVELPAPSNGVVTKIVKQAGEQAVVGEVIGYLDAVSPASQSAPAASPEVPAASQPQSVDVRHRVGSTVIGSVQPASGTGPSCQQQQECWERQVFHLNQFLVAARASESQRLMPFQRYRRPLRRQRLFQLSLIQMKSDDHLWQEQPKSQHRAQFAVSDLS